MKETRYLKKVINQYLQQEIFSLDELFEDNFFTQTYPQAAYTDLESHKVIIRLLLSSPQGIGLFWVLFQRGFQIFYPNSTDKCQKTIEIEETIKQARTSLKEFDRDGFMEFYQRIAGLAPISPQDKTRADMYLHASFLKIYLNTYLFKNTEKNNELIEQMKHYLYSYILNLPQNKEIKQDESKENYYFLLGHSVDLTINALSTFFTTQFNKSKKLYLFLLKNFEIDTDSWSFFKNIAVQTMLSILEADFEVEEARLDEFMSLTYEQMVEKNPSLTRFDRTNVFTASKHQLIQFAATIAPRIGQAHKLPLFIKWAETVEPFYRVDHLSTQEKATYDKGFIYTPGIITRDYLKYPALAESPFENTIKQIHDMFHTPSAWENFFHYLNIQLEYQLKHLPTLSTACIDNQIKLFDMSFPNQEGYEWWKNLSPQEKALQQALHRILLEIENTVGYNLPFNDGIEGVPRFFGFIPQKEANRLITKEKRIFKESPYEGAAIPHGINSHRIQIAALIVFIIQKRVTLPEGESFDNLLAFIINENLWGTLFDRVGTHFSSPHYLMTYLRNISQYPYLQKYCVFHFFKQVEKFRLYDCSVLDYATIVLTYAAHDEAFTSLAQKSLFQNLLPKSDFKYTEIYDKNDNQPDAWSVVYFKKNPKQKTKYIHPEIDFVPLSRTFFSNRQDLLQQLHQSNDLIDYKMRLNALHIITGMGGVGKTYLAWKYAEQHHKELAITYPFEASNAKSSVSSLLRLIKGSYPQTYAHARAMLGKSAKDTDILKLTLSAIPNWLLIIDGAQDSSEIEAFIPDLTAHLNQHLIVTSRNNHWPTLQEHVLTVKPFNVKEAIFYLQQLLPTATIEELTQLAFLFDGLPTGLAQASLTIRNLEIGVPKYIEYFTNDRKSLWDIEKKPHDYQHTISTTWNEDIQGLDQNSLAQAILYCLAFSKTTSLSISYFSALEEEAVEEALDLLSQYSLIDYDKQLKQITFLSVLQLVLQDQLAEQGLSSKFIKLALALLGSECNSDLINKLDSTLIDKWKTKSDFKKHVLDEFTASFSLLYCSP